MVSAGLEGGQLTVGVAGRRGPPGCATRPTRSQDLRVGASLGADIQRVRIKVVPREPQTKLAGPGRHHQPAWRWWACALLAAWELSHGLPRDSFMTRASIPCRDLAHLRPESLSQDVFLKFGSQDRFTIFSALYALPDRVLGIEAAAAWLTLLSQIALLAGAWTLARVVMPGEMALLGVAVLAAVPGEYGAGRVFTCIEPFLTPRMAAESLALAGLAAAMSARAARGALLIAAAALLHPVMAAAGIAALCCRYVVGARARWAVALAAAGLLALVVEAFAAPAGAWGPFDEGWLELVRNRSPYLFLQSWRVDDWSIAAVVERHAHRWAPGRPRSSGTGAGTRHFDDHGGGSLTHRDRLRCAASGALHADAAVALAVAGQRGRGTAPPGDLAHAVGEECRRPYHRIADRRCLDIRPRTRTR